jgi:uncharacterized protein YbaR (Trm112 family)
MFRSAIKAALTAEGGLMIDVLQDLVAEYAEPYHFRREPHQLHHVWNSRMASMNLDYFPICDYPKCLLHAPPKTRGVSIVVMLKCPDCNPVYCISSEIPTVCACGNLRVYTTKDVAPRRETQDPETVFWTTEREPQPRARLQRIPTKRKRVTTQSDDGSLRSAGLRSQDVAKTN